ncbi:MAG: hypothetical protein MAG431_01635 [Chloroflexi bacterium]|nr:hypothetical protein [Chloroflexota bacterium]
MITKNLTEFQNSEGTVSFMGQLRSMMKHGFSWRKEQENQEKLIGIIETMLNNECLLLRNVSIPKVEKPIPLILLTPAGIMLINPKYFSGTFEVRDDVWRELSGKDLVPTRPNPIREVVFYANALLHYFEGHALEDVPLERVVVLTSMGAHVKTKHPAVRIIPFDALKNFAREIGTSEPILSREEIIEFAKLLAKPRPPSYSTPYPEREDSPQLPDTSPKVVQDLEATIQKLNFNKRQWIILGIILAGQVLLVVAFILFILFA